MKPMQPSEFHRLSQIAEEEAGLHLPDNKQTFVSSRLQKRLRANGLESFAEYIMLLENRTEVAERERSEFISALTTNVTGVFREAHHFQALAEFLIERRSKNGRQAAPLRVWSAGCSSGEEALSIAATFWAVFGPSWMEHVRILATDIDRKILRDAAHLLDGDQTEIRSALESGLAELKMETPHGVPQNLETLQSATTFMQHNLLQPLPTSSPFDVIFCRNVTIYFEQEARARVHANLLACLSQGGLLVIGHSERLLSSDPDVALIATTTYQKAQTMTGAI